MHRRDFLVLLPGGAAMGCVAGCGTFLHPERVHSVHSRDIDWKVAALNGLGLAFFFVPGVVAFAIDFYTGAIYLPPEYGAHYPSRAEAMPVPSPPGSSETVRAAQRPAPSDSAAPSSDAAATPGGADAANEGLRKVSLSKEQLTPAEIEQRVSDHVGRRVQLDAFPTRVSPMKSLADFRDHEEMHDNDPTFGMSIKKFFRRWHIG